jgi:glycerol-3-phosphate acyltransferase PlsY
MEITYSVILALFAFLLAGCPFSLWIGKWFLHKDIRTYGDGNPGATNVFRAGSIFVGALAIFMDTAKGFPFVYLASNYYHLSDLSVLAIAVCVLLGHAYSPILKFRGGKALAVTLGVLLAIPQYELLLSLLTFVFIAFLIIKSDSWRVIFGAICSCIFFVVTTGISFTSILALCILTIWTLKQFHDLLSMPRLNGALISWVRSRRI